MSSLYLHVQIDQPDTARAWAGAIAARLRATANLIERAGGPLSVTDDWPNLESWAGNTLGPLGPPSAARPGSRVDTAEANGQWPPADAYTSYPPEHREEEAAAHGEPPPDTLPLTAPVPPGLPRYPR